MTAVIAAMQKEADVLLSAAEIKEEKIIYGRRAWRGSFAGTPFLLVLSGIGKSNAASAAMLCIALGADRLLNIGVAGGLTPKAPVGSVLQMERAAESDFDLSKINGTPVGTPNERDTPYFPLKSRRNAFRNPLYCACNPNSKALRFISTTASPFGANTRRMLSRSWSGVRMPIYLAAIPSSTIFAHLGM